LHRVLQSHPDVFSLRKELCPAGADEDETATFADLLQFTAGQVQNDDGTWRHLDPEAMQADCVMEFGPSWIDVCSYFYSGAGPGGSERRATVLQSCIQTDTVNALHGMAPALAPKVLYLQRDPADLLWSMYNLWEGKTHGKSGGMVDWWNGSTMRQNRYNHTSPARYNHKSPEQFHGIVMSRDGPSDWSEFMGLHEMKRLRDTFGEENVRLFRSEDLRSPPQLELLFRFVGLDIGLVSPEVQDGVTNSQGLQRGMYEASNYRPMLCTTRELIYSDARRACFELQARFGLRYPACLGEVSAC